MAHSPVFHDKGTRFTNYSSIHSADAFVGDYQVMYTPGATSPEAQRATKKSTRFSRNLSSAKPLQNISQSVLLPSNMPNTSQIMPDQGALPNIQVHYNIPADEKQIVASLRALQRDLNEAMETISALTRERDEAVQELRLLKANGSARRPLSPPRRTSRNIEDALFDLSSPIQDLPRHPSNPKSKKETQEQRMTEVSDDARVLSTRIAKNNAAADRLVSAKSVRQPSKSRRAPIAEETEQSMVEENPTAASNTSRRRRRTSLDENMTSAYIIPDITMEQQVRSPVKVSQAAQNVLHSLDPNHIDQCDVCHRLTKHIKAQEKERRNSAPSKPLEPASKVKDFATTTSRSRVTVQPDYTAALAGFVDQSMLGDATMRPKLPPSQALLRVKILMDAQFKKAKDRHGVAWEKYNRIEAPLSSKKHAEISKEMQHWAEKMEECRVHLDYLRDVEEGMEDEDA